MAYVRQDHTRKEAFGKFGYRRRVGLKVVILALSCAIIASPMLMMAKESEAYAGSLASYYSLWGGVTASGEVLDYNDWSAAHRTLPFGTKITVCYRWGCAHGVTITDRGPAAWTGRDLDLNMIVAEKIGLVAHGEGAVDWWVSGYDPYYLAHIS